MSENKPRCCQLVPSGFGRLRHFKREECGKPAKIEREGKYYCGIHDPMRKAERAAKRDARYAENREVELAEWAAERERDRRADLFPKMLAAAEAVLEWQKMLYHESTSAANISFRDWLGNGSVGKLYDALAKAKGEQS